MLRMQHIYLLMIGLSLTGCEKGPRPQSPLSMESSGKPTTVSYAPEYGRRKSAGNDPNNAGNPDNGGGNNNVNPQPAANDVTIDANKLETIKQTLNYHSPIVLASEVGDITGGAVLGQRSNPIARTLDFTRKTELMNAMNFYIFETSTKQKPPATTKAFVRMLTDGLVELEKLEDGCFYIYDPEKAMTQDDRNNIEYLSVFKK